MARQLAFPTISTEEQEMTGWRKRTITEMAREASYDVQVPDFLIPVFERFAKLVREDERELCAKVCEDSVEYAGDELARQIRARGDKHEHLHQ
jgi:hypothetical protein